MSLAGLLAAVAEDPQLSTALASPPDLPGGERDLVAPPALRPLVVGSLATGIGGQGAVVPDPIEDRAGSRGVPGGYGGGSPHSGEGVVPPGDDGVPGRFVLAVTATAR